MWPKIVRQGAKNRQKEGRGGQAEQHKALFYRKKGPTMGGATLSTLVIYLQICCVPRNADMTRSRCRAPTRIWSAGTFTRCVKKKFSTLSLSSAIENRSFSIHAQNTAQTSQPQAPLTDDWRAIDKVIPVGRHRPWELFGSERLCRKKNRKTSWMVESFC